MSKLNIIVGDNVNEKYNFKFNQLCSIVKEKIKDKKIEYKLDENVVELIACCCRNNEALIDETINLLWAYTEIHKPERITLEIAVENLIEISNRIDNPIIIDKIKEAVASKYGITTQDLISRNRTPEILYPRKIAMYVCRLLTNVNVANLSRIHFGGRDPIILIRSCEQIAEDLINNPSLVSEINDIIATVQKKK